MDRTKFRDADILIMTQAQIDAHFGDFRSDEVVINSTSRQVRIGPGSWSECTLVLDLSLPDTNTLLALESLRISGGGSTVAERWLRDGFSNGKPKYKGVGTDDLVHWHASKWKIEIGQVTAYESGANTATPELVPEWTPVGPGLAPSPVVTRITADTLQQVLEVLSLSTVMLRRDRPAPLVGGAVYDQARVIHFVEQVTSGSVTVNYAPYSAAFLVGAQATSYQGALPGRVLNDSSQYLSIEFVDTDLNPLPDSTPVSITIIGIP